MAVKFHLTQEEFDALTSEEIKAEYKKQTDGSYVLDVTGAVSKKTHDEFRNNNTDLKKKLEDFEGIDPTKALDAIKIKERFDKGELVEPTGADDIEAQLESRTNAMREEHATLVATLTGERDAATAQLEERLINAEIIAQATSYGLLNNPDAQKFIADLGRSTFKLEDGKPVAYDEKGEKMFSASGNPFTIEDFIAGKAKDTPFLFKENKGAGAGGGGGDGGADGGANPWSKENWNMTNQMQMVQKDKAKATRLAAMHGHTL